MLDKGTVINTVERYANAVKQEFSPFAVVLFGSYAKGGANDDSDIDVGVIFKGFHGDWMKTSSRLWNLAYDISWDIEPHLLDTTQDKSGFVKHVFKTGQVIYQA
ncbi:MAG: nucleotidyltransferase domain-containing protein [Oscillospiraceae bacterium]|jgi:predicted nucleotidyltransferase|nr:nucleotidyltransferase domain-containing protein [Oscillospiraceae bacterium]